VKDDFFCPEPYRNISSKPYGYYQACCIASTKAHKLHNMKVDNSSFKEFYDSDYMNTLRKDMLEGVKSKTVRHTCEKCIYDEKQSGKSRRTNVLKRYSKEEILNSPFKLDSLKLKFIGNLCNAKCVMCSPNISSMFAQEAYELGNWDGKITHSIAPNKKYLKNLKEVLPSTETLNFVGGEPVINKLTWEFIEWLISNKLTHHTLSFTTNGKVFFTKKQKVLLKQFKSIRILFSIDAPGDKNNYIRFPSPPAKIFSNLDKFLNENYQTELTTTVSWLNIGDLPNLKKILKKNYSEVPWAYNNVVEKPYIFRPSILPADIKKLYLERGVIDESFSKILETPFDKDLFTKAMKFIKTLDKKRNNNLIELWPEYTKYYLDV
tara:strand:+ start:1850 stop:2980 length:1131 start_codon:yes stop_codon:yes gene_type:complete